MGSHERRPPLRGAKCGIGASSLQNFMGFAPVAIMPGRYRRNWLLGYRDWLLGYRAAPAGAANEMFRPRARTPAPYPRTL
jgi:hypothetical protein